MINYSIVMRSVNSNLLEINQARARVKAARMAGETPEQADLDLIATEERRAFAVAQYAEVMTIEKFAKHIATHGCVYSRADISAILYMAVDCMRELLLDGKKVRLGVCFAEACETSYELIDGVCVPTFATGCAGYIQLEGEHCSECKENCGISVCGNYYRYYKGACIDAG